MQGAEAGPRRWGRGRGQREWGLEKGGGDQGPRVPGCDGRMTLQWSLVAVGVVFTVVVSL